LAAPVKDTAHVPEKWNLDLKRRRARGNRRAVPSGLRFETRQRYVPQRASRDADYLLRRFNHELPLDDFLVLQVPVGFFRFSDTEVSLARDEVTEPFHFLGYPFVEPSQRSCEDQ